VVNVIKTIIPALALLLPAWNIHASNCPEQLSGVLHKNNLQSLQDNIWRLQHSGDHELAARRAELLARALGEGAPVNGRTVKIREASTEVYKIDLDNGLSGVFKPDMPDNPISFYKHEVAAWIVDGLTGTGIVPVTVARKMIINGTERTGSFQLFVKNDGTAAELIAGARTNSETLVKQIENSAQYKNMRFLDWLISNRDRQGRNILARTDPDTGITQLAAAIDHSLSFGTSGAWRPFFIMPDPPVMLRLGAIGDAEIFRRLSPWLEPQKIQDLIKRKNWFLANFKKSPDGKSLAPIDDAAAGRARLDKEAAQLISPDYHKNRLKEYMQRMGVFRW